MNLVNVRKNSLTYIFVIQNVLEETLYDALNDGSYDGIIESVAKSRKRNKEKSAIGYDVESNISNSMVDFLFIMSRYSA